MPQPFHFYVALRMADNRDRGNFAAEGKYRPAAARRQERSEAAAEGRVAPLRPGLQRRRAPSWLASVRALGARRSARPLS